MRLAGDRAGFGLLILVAIIAIAGIVLFSSVGAYQDMARETQLRIDETKAHYLAQAGVMQSIWNWYTSNTTTEMSRTWAPINTTVTGNNLYKVGMDSAGAYLQSNYAYVAPKLDIASQIAFVKTVATGTSQTNGKTVVATVPGGGGATIGNFLVIAAAMDDGAGTVTIADNVGSSKNVYIKAADQVFATHVRTLIFYALVQSTLTAGNTITMTLQSNTVAKVLSVNEFSGVTGFDVTSASATGTSKAPLAGALTGTYNNELIFGAMGIEGPAAPTDTFAAAAGYTTAPPTSSGTTLATAANNITINPEYQIVTSAASRTPGGTLTAAANRSWEAIQATFHGSAGWVTPSGTTTRLGGWRLLNAHNASAITLTQIKVSWSPAGTEVLNDFVLNGVSKWVGGTLASGAVQNCTDTALNSGSSWSTGATYLQWDKAPNAGGNVTVNCQFTFSAAANSDATTSEVVLWNGAQAPGAGLPSARTYSVVSTGQVNQSGGKYFKVMKSIKAKVSGAPGTSAVEIVDWEEEDNNIP